MAKASKSIKSTNSTTSAKASASGVAATQPVKATATKVAATKSKPVATSCCGGSSCDTPSNDHISQRAYEIWVAKGYPQGQDLQNWQQAEAELMKGSLVAA